MINYAQYFRNPVPNRQVLNIITTGKRALLGMEMGLSHVEAGRRQEAPVADETLQLTPPVVTDR